MDTSLSWRKTQAGDLAECLRLHPAKNGAEIVGHARALGAWKQLLEASHATRSAVIEMHQANGLVQIVGFGLSSFVRKSFVEDEMRNPRAGLNARIIESIVNGSPVIATYAEVRDANTRGDLQQVNLDASFKNGPLTPAQVDEARGLLGLAHHELFAGYRLSRILLESTGQRDSLLLRGQKEFRVVSRFKESRRKKAKTGWNRGRSLLEVTLDSIRKDPFSAGAGLFQHHVAPQFGFTRAEQELLDVAQEGGDDAFIAKSLFVSLPAIKRRWSSVFDRVSLIRPDLCPVDGEGKRGVQKRHRILTYVRSHPEELRPFNPSKKKLGGT